MQPHINSIRSFIGSKDFSISRDFYGKIGFTERAISKDMSLFSMGAYSFYLQDAYVKQWINNTMLFLEVENLEEYFRFLEDIAITKIRGLRLSQIQEQDWGREFFLHDPSGVLWHIGNFN